MVDICFQMLAVQASHTIDEDADIFMLTSIYQSLYILRFILFEKEFWNMKRETGIS